MHLMMLPCTSTISSTQINIQCFLFVYVVIETCNVCTCRLLESSRLSGEGDVWKVSRCMSGDELRLAVEERSLAGVCANPRCDHQVDDQNPFQKHLDVLRGRLRKSYICCSEECYNAVEVLSNSLGSHADAMKRFQKLYRLAMIHRKTKNDGINKNMEPEKKKNQKSGGAFKLAAGSQKSPIMKADVKERPTNGTVKVPSGTFDANVIEGYAPKSLLKSSGKAQQKKQVQFAEQLEQYEPEESNQRCAPREQTDHNGMTHERTTHVTPMHDDTDRVVMDSNAPKIVFEIEDPAGPVESNMGESLGARFGTLRIENFDNRGEQQFDQSTSDGVSIRQNQGIQLDEMLAKTLRQGASKYFPQLQQTLPSELFAGADGSDATSDASENSEDWMLSDDEIKSEEDVDISYGLTFFGELFSNLDYWITDNSIRLVHPKRNYGDTAASIPQVPEIMTALQRLVSVSTGSMVTQLKADAHRHQILQSVQNMLRTFHLDQPLPAFQSRQWKILSLIIFKALSMEAHPEFQAYVDTRSGVSRIGSILAEANFTVEEMYAVLELFMTEEE